MYQALYRKYRPRRFCDVAGQEHITETLLRQITSVRLSHAYLFVGTRGTGKTTCAKILSRAVNCMDLREGEPCNKCISCVGIEDGSILDVLELDAASNNSVDNVRALRDEAVYSPATVKKRVYIIDEVHMLSPSAFNALLKILEEPPEHILFILATTELHKVPATIQGRCQKFSFKRLSPAALTDRLNLIADSENLALTADAAAKLAFLADGSMRDGISLLDQCVSDKVIDLERVRNTLGLAGQQELTRIVETVACNNIPAALIILNELYDDGRDMASLLNEMASLLRDLLVYKISPDSGLLINTNFDNETYNVLSRTMSPDRLFLCLDVLKSTIAELPRAGSSRLAVEICLIKMCDIQPVATPDITGTSMIPDTMNHDITGESQAPVIEGTHDFWQEILNHTKSDPSLYPLISNSSEVKARHQDDVLVISVSHPLTASTIKSSVLLEEAAKKALGNDVRIRVEEIN